MASVDFDAAQRRRGKDAKEQRCGVVDCPKGPFRPRRSSAPPALEAHRNVAVFEPLLAAARLSGMHAPERMTMSVRSEVVDVAQVDLVATVAFKEGSILLQTVLDAGNDSSASISRPSRRRKTTCLLRASAYSMSDRRRAW